MLGVVLLCASQAGAQSNGTGDPHGLIAYGAIQPFWAGGASIAVIDITSPVGDNSGGFFSRSNPLHAIFFNASCVRDFSIPTPVTENGLLVFTADELGVDYTGLLVLAGTEDQVTMVPASFPFHVRSEWINFGGDWIREVDPIAVRSAESNQTYSPLRSAASFASMLEDATFHTEIFLICPSPTTVLPVLPVSNGFPTPPRIAYAAARANALIVGVIYDEDEAPLRNITLPCNCSSMFPVLDINAVYGDPSASSVFYTELATYTTVSGAEDPRTFTGYRSITVTAGGVWPGGTGDDFGRLHNGSAAAYLNLIEGVPGLR
jgi:hypothetical protein